MPEKYEPRYGDEVIISQDGFWQGAIGIVVDADGAGTYGVKLCFSQDSIRYFEADEMDLMRPQIHLEEPVCEECGDDLDHDEAPGTGERGNA